MILVIILLILGIASLTVSLDPDLGWHLYLGKYILEHKTLVQNFIGYNVFEHLKRPDHEWLSNIVFYQITRHFGYVGLVIFFVLLLSATFYFLYQTYKKLTSNSFSAYFILIFATLPFFTAFSVRVQYILIFALAFFLYVKYCVNSPSRRMLVYFTSGLIINNFHGGFVTLLPAVALLELDVFDNSGFTRKAIGQYLLTIVALFLPALLNPYGLGYIDLLISYSNNYYRSHITEWLPVFSPSFANYAIVLLLPLATLTFLILIEKFYSKLRYHEIIPLLLYGYLGIMHIRQFPIFVIILGIFASRALASLIREIHPPRLLKISAGIFLILTVLVSCSYNGNLKKFIHYDQWKGVDKDSTSYPQKAMDYISKNKPQNSGKFLNPYDWGGYIVWAYPNQSIFIDGRGPEKLIDNNRSIMEEYQRLGDGSNDEIKEKFAKYNFTYVMIQKKSDSGGESRLLERLLRVNSETTKKDKLQAYLDESPDWREVFRDELSIVYYKK